MSDEKEVIEGKAVAEDVKEEKKENAFSKFFKKTKESVSNSVLEMKIDNKFRNDNEEATIYSGNILPDTIYGYLNDNCFVAYGEHELKKNSILIFKNKPYYIDSVSPKVVEVVLDGVAYERKATRYMLDPNVTEVNVIKVDKHYYLVKEK